MIEQPAETAIAPHTDGAEEAAREDSVRDAFTRLYADARAYAAAEAEKQKLRAGMLRALEKRPVSVEDLEAAISRLCHRPRATGEREVPARQVGGFVMEALQQLDDVAYVRFASVYRSFQDISEFAAEVDRLRGRAGGGEPQDDDTPQQ